jgi:hypothetical protein
MAFTEIKKRNENKYYYRVTSFREGNKISKKRKYLGANLSKEELNLKESQADKELGILDINPNKKIFEKIKSIAIMILKKNNIKKAGIFGSYATGKNKKSSDVDIIVEPPKNIGLGFVRIQFELEDNLKKKVDLITYNSVHPLLKKRILNEEVKII